MGPRDSVKTPPRMMTTGRGAVLWAAVSADCLSRSGALRLLIAFKVDREKSRLSRCSAGNAKRG